MSASLDSNKIIALLEYARNQNRLKTLENQIQKDFSRAGISVLSSDMFMCGQPIECFNTVTERLYRLIMEDFDGYLNLMYAADVPEKAFEQVEASDSVDAARQSAIVLIEREWEKVCTRLGVDASIPTGDG